MARKLVSVIETLGRGGAERLLVTLHEHLDRSRFDPEVVALWGPNPLAAELRDLGVVVHEMGFEGPGAALRGTLGLRSLLKERKADVVHTHLYFANLTGRLAAWGTRTSVVTTLHNPDYSYEDTRTRRFKAKKWLDRKTGRAINDAFVAVSKEVRWDFERHLGFRNVTVIPNFLDVSSFQARIDGHTKDGARAALDLPGEVPVLLHVGRLHRQKGQEVIIEALPLIHEAHPGTMLLLIGEGREREALENLARRTGVSETVRLMGSVPDVTPALAAADLFVFPSRWEAFGIALLEAMAAGVPSVASGVGGITEVVTEGTTELLLIRHPKALAKIVVELLSDGERRAAMSRAGRERARQFDVAAQLPALEAVYEAI